MADHILGWTRNLGVSQVRKSFFFRTPETFNLNFVFIISVAEMNITTKTVALKPIIQTVQYAQRIQTTWKRLKNGNI